MNVGDIDMRLPPKVRFTARWCPSTGEPTSRSGGLSEDGKPVVLGPESDGAVHSGGVGHRRGDVTDLAVALWAEDTPAGHRLSSSASR